MRLKLLQVCPERVAGRGDFHMECSFVECAEARIELKATMGAFVSWERAVGRSGEGINVSMLHTAPLDLTISVQSRRAFSGRVQPAGWAVRRS
jgi:hypothetical protein